MRAAVLLASGRIAVEERPAPVPGPGELVVALDACGICGSDLMGWYTARKAPTVLGHEVVGRITRIGADLGQAPAGWRVGERVFVHHHVPCGACELCRAGHETLCDEFRASHLEPGGFADEILVPAAHVRQDVLRLPDTLPTLAATLLEPLACCLRGIARLGLRSGERAAVVGLGQMGQLYGRALAAAGVEVLGLDPLPNRRALAAAAGLTVATPDSASARALVPGRLAAVVLCSGAPAAIELALELAGSGTVVQLFAPAAPGAVLSVDVNRLFFNEIQIQASYSAGAGDLTAARQLLADGTLPTAGLITHTFPLDATGEAMRVAKEDPTAVKVVVLGDHR